MKSKPRSCRGNAHDVCACGAQLQDLHPDNRHVRDKIRQQLQDLRDLGLVEFPGNGRYRAL